MRRRTSSVLLACVVGLASTAQRARADEGDVPETHLLVLDPDGTWRPRLAGDPLERTGLWLRLDVADRQILLHRYALEVRDILQDSVDELRQTVDQANAVIQKDDEVLQKLDASATRLENLVHAPPAMSSLERALWLGGAVVLGAAIGVSAVELAR